MSWEEIVTKVSRESEMQVKEVIDTFPYLPHLAKSLRESKVKVINDMKRYIDVSMKNVEKLGGKAFFAKDANEAQRIIGELVGEEKTVVFSKTNVAIELKLREFLKERHNEVWETDLGEFLLQITDNWPSHIVTPALELTKEDAARAVSKIDSSINENSSINDIVASVRKFLMTKYLQADIAITGANAIAADTGSVLLVENEGNIRIDTVLPQTHIVVTGTDKIVPTILDAINEVLVQAGYAGSFPPTYINVTSGPSSTEDLEQVRVSPATGPKKFILILVDNGRLAASEEENLRDALLCIRCGRCYFSCPVYRVLGKNWVGTKSPYNGPMGVMWNYITNKDPWPASYCTHSGGCKEVCPMEIDIPSVIRYIKSISSKSLI